MLPGQCKAEVETDMWFGNGVEIRICSFNVYVPAKTLLVIHCADRLARIGVVEPDVCSKDLVDEQRRYVLVTRQRIEAGVVAQL